MFSAPLFTVCYVLSGLNTPLNSPALKSLPVCDLFLLSDWFILSHVTLISSCVRTLTRRLVAKTGSEIVFVCLKPHSVTNSIRVVYYYQSEITVCNSGHYSGINIPQCNAVVLTTIITDGCRSVTPITLQFMCICKISLYFTLLGEIYFLN